jgi:hypothetical protein
VERLNKPPFDDFPCLGASRTNKDNSYIAKTQAGTIQWQLMPLLFLQYRPCLRFAFIVSAKQQNGFLDGLQLIACNV